MAKQYEESLVRALKERQTEENYHGAPLLVKNLPDCDEKGAMDPRLYRDQKKALGMMAWTPPLPDEDGHLPQGHCQSAEDVQRH